MTTGIKEYGNKAKEKGEKRKGKRKKGKKTRTL